VDPSVQVAPLRVLFGTQIFKIFVTTHTVPLLVFIAGVGATLTILDIAQNSLKRTTAIFSVTNLTSLGNSQFCQIRILLDQGSAKFKNNQQQIWIYWVGGGVILVGVVLNNAYKGDNIVQITSPLPARVYKTLEDIVESNFQLYSSSFPDLNLMYYDQSAHLMSLPKNITMLDYLKVSQKRIFTTED